MTYEEKCMVLEFLKVHQMAVVATAISGETSPESALVAFVSDDDLCIYFQTGESTRKAQNIAQNPNISLVIGHDHTEMATLQYEGKAQQIINGKEIETCKWLFHAKNSPAREYLDRPSVTFYKVAPRWLQLTNYSAKPHTTVIELSF